MFDNLRADLNRAMRETRTDPNWKPSLGKRLEVMVRHATWPVLAYRYSRWARSVRIPVVAQLLRIFGLFFRKFVEVFTSVHIDARANIGPGFVIHSVYAINLGATKIGENFTIATGCLISHACRGIGDNVYFGPGAKLVGDAKIGSNVVIAANSLVLTDVRDNMMVMGVPARIKLPGGNPRRFVKKAEEPVAAAEVKNGPAAQSSRAPASVSV
jgi:serine O-acetyltransferase